MNESVINPLGSSFQHGIEVRENTYLKIKSETFLLPPGESLKKF